MNLIEYNIYFDISSVKNYHVGSSQRYIIIDLDNGLVPIRCPTII